MTTQDREEGPDLILSSTARITLNAVQALSLSLFLEVGPTFLKSASFAPLLAATSAMVGYALPDCPFAPAGVNVQPDFDPVSHDQMLRCMHPGHCWDRDGKYYPCP